MNRDPWLAFVLAWVLIGMPSVASAGEALQIVSPVAYKDGLVVRDAVKAECRLRTRVPAYIQEFTKERSPVKLVESVDGAKGKVLTVEIEDVQEAGRGGPKSLTIRGELRENGKLIGTIKARRSTIGGPFGGFGGSCGILHRCAKALGKDLANWIEAPEMNVELYN